MLCNAHYLIKWRKEHRNPQPLKVLRNPYRPRLLHCSIKNCKNNDYATGLCKNHYMQKWRKANPKLAKTNAAKSYQKNKKKILAKDKVYRTKNRGKRNKQKSLSGTTLSDFLIIHNWLILLYYKIYRPYYLIIS